MTTTIGLEPYQPLRGGDGEGTGKIVSASSLAGSYYSSTSNRKIMNDDNTTTSNNYNHSVQNRAMMMSSSSRQQSSSWINDPQQQPAPARLQRQSSEASSSHQRSSSSETDTTTHLIEEKRKRANGAEGYTLHKYTLGRLLGKGGFAKVYLCTAMDTGKNYAVKVVPKANLTKARARQKLQAEIKIHRMLKHKHVCQYKHYFEDRKNCYILLELCHNQSLNEMIKRRKRVTEPEAAYFMHQLLEATRYMHSENVIHRDLKLGNLFLDRDMNIKVGDLGLATQVEDKDEKRKTICGTPNYIAPEIIQGDKAKRGHSFEVDVWSMGVILYTILVGKPPYEAKDVKATYQRILNNEYSFPRHVNISSSVKSLIKSMLQSKPKDRPTLQEIEMHPFLVDSVIPTHLPSSTLSLAPVWRMDDSGELVCTPLDNNNNSKLSMARSNNNNSFRQPFASRDPNKHKASSTTTSSSSKPRKEARDVVNMERVVKAAVAAMTGSSSTKAAAPSKFSIFDDSSNQQQQTNHVKSPPPTASLTEDALVQQTRAMSLGESNLPPPPPPFGPPTVLTHVTDAENDADILQRMADHLDAVINVTTSRKGSYRSTPVRSLPSRRGPSKWVTRYVDYTSKYGLGFLLNDGSSGVYFNDSTKAALEKGSDDFLYVERKKVTEGKRRGETVSETHHLEKYPETLKKKVTLLKHFRDYLMQQQMGQDDDLEQQQHNDDASDNAGLVYVKKWVRTKHAILFSLSDRTVQIIFYDQTEILLTPDVAFLTYVDKQRRRSTYHFTDELVGTSAEIEKRLKYTNEILLQLLNGGGSTTTTTK